MRILGLDLSLRSTGYALLDNDQVVWHGSVGGDNHRDVERLAMFDEWIREAVCNQAGRPREVLALWHLDHVAIEGYSFGSVSHHHAIGELGGVVKLAIYQAQIPITVIPPATWKKQLLGKGNLQKDQVRLECFKRFAVEFPSQDTLDAWAVAMCLRRQLLGLIKPAPVSRRKSQQTIKQEAHDQEGSTTSHRTAGTAPA